MADFSERITRQYRDKMQAKHMIVHASYTYLYREVVELMEEGNSPLQAVRMVARKYGGHVEGMIFDSLILSHNMDVKTEHHRTIRDFLLEEV